MQNYDSIRRTLASIFKFGPRTGTGHERDIVGAYSTFHPTNCNKYLKTHVHSVKFWNIFFQFRMGKTFLAWKPNKKKTSLEQIFYNSRMNYILYEYEEIYRQKNRPHRRHRYRQIKHEISGV